MDKDESLCREDFRSIFKNFDIISTDYDNGIWHHIIYTDKYHITIYEGEKGMRYEVWMEWGLNNLAMYRVNTKEELLEKINNIANPVSWFRKKIIKSKLYIQKVKTILWKIKTKLKSPQ